MHVVVCDFCGAKVEAARQGVPFHIGKERYEVAIHRISSESGRLKHVKCDACPACVLDKAMTAGEQFVGKKPDKQEPACQPN